MEILVSVAGVTCAVIAIVSFVNDRKRRREKSRQRQRRIEIGCLTASLLGLGLAWILTRK